MSTACLKQVSFECFKKEINILEANIHQSIKLFIRKKKQHSLLIVFIMVVIADVVVVVMVVVVEVVSAKRKSTFCCYRSLRVLVLRIEF
jgi:hypothetical protein